MIGQDVALIDVIDVVISLTFLSGFLSIVIYLLYIGIQWLRSSGDIADTEAARHKITWVVIGVIIMFVSFAIYQALLACMIAA